MSNPDYTVADAATLAALPLGGIHALQFPSIAGESTAAKRRGWLMGWSASEISGTAPARLQIWNGSSAAGVLLGTISLLANQGNVTWLGAPGIPWDMQLNVRNVAGAADLVVYVRL